MANDRVIGANSGSSAPAVSLRETIARCQAPFDKWIDQRSADGKAAAVNHATVVAANKGVFTSKYHFHGYRKFTECGKIKR